MRTPSPSMPPSVLEERDPPLHPLSEPDWRTGSEDREVGGPCRARGRACQIRTSVEQPAQPPAAPPAHGASTSTQARRGSVLTNPQFSYHSLR